MSFKKYGLPIFVLYMLTSIILLSFFCYFYYKTSNEKLKIHISKELTSIMGQIAVLAKSDEISTLSFKQIDDAKILIFDITNRNFIKKDFDFDLNSLKFKKHKHAKYFMPNSEQFFINDGEIFLYENLHFNKMKNNYIVLLRSNEYSEEKLEIISKIVTIFLCSILFFLIVSYFIIKLSFRPLIEKINSLNSFIKDTTHEINTPLSVILMSIEMFENYPEKYLSNIKIAAKTLSNLYENLVNLNLKTTQNTLENINVKEILNERIKYFSIMLGEKNLSLNTDLSEVWLKTDEFKFKNIFDNILSNAIKYCAEKTEISVILCKNYFEISNFGNEISKEQKSKIFEKFTRFNAEKGGFGIGLSLVKKYCDELGFKISCESKNQKTSFRVKF